ncbi:MAG: ATP-binding cassette domain-containing protein [Alphaproteobacteria bacterium]|nr:MAG: ATP-binding cassette domain-containing protein [Alphaproteobacteria bacterium]
MNTLHTFTETQLHATRLQGALGGISPIAGTPQANVWMSAMAALAPHLAVEEVLGAWPVLPSPHKHHNNHVAAWWNLATNLGYEVLPASYQPPSDAHSCWCWLRPDGDIWLSHNGTTLWHAASRTIHSASSLPRGDWVRLVSHTRPEPATVTTADLLIGGIHPVLPTLLLSSLLVQGLGVMLPVFIMVVYDHVIDGRAPVGYTALLTGMLVALMAEAALRRIRGTLLVRAGIRAETFWINRLVAQLIHLPAALVERASLSSQLNRLKGVEIFRDMAVSPIVLGALDVPFVALVLLVMFLVAGELVLIPLMLIGAYLVVMLAALPWIKSTLRTQARMSDHQQGLVLEASHNHLALRADGLTDIWMERIAANGMQSMATTSRSTFLQHALEVISLLGSSLAGLLTLSAGVSMVQAGTLSAGGLIASMMLVWRMLAPLSLLCTALPRLVQMFQTALQLTQFLNLQTETPPLAPPAPMQLPQPAPQGDLTLTNISLRYRHEHAQVLNNLSATIKAGQLVMVMGSNGSGKSTLLKVIVGLYPLQGGNLRLDGIDTRQWDPERLRSHIAYLPQQPDMFTDTIATNLRLANPLATDDDLWNALELADAAETVRQLPNALHEHLGHQDVPEIFAHQLNLARLYLNQAPFVLADELPGTLLTLPAGRNFIQWVLSQRGQRTLLVVGNYQALQDAAAMAIGLKAESTALVGPAKQVFHSMHGPQTENLLQFPSPQQQPTNGDTPHAA